MLRWLYLQLLWAHPASFRHRFGDEMLEAFDLTFGRREHWLLLADGLLSVGRQWALRSEFHDSLEPAPASGSQYELITFRQIEPYKPSRVALAQGGLFAILLIFGVVSAINHGGGGIRTFVIGMRRPGFGIIKVNRNDFEGKPLIATQKATDDEDPLRPFARSYARIVHVLAALDADGDLTISAAEIANAPAALLTLDLNHDGKLSAEECGFLPPGDFNGPATLRARHARTFMRTNPLLAVLDADHDGVISAEEIANSPAALRQLDIDRSGSLSAYDVLPHPAVTEAAAIVNRFDINDSGVVSVQGLPKDDPDLAAMAQILVAADRNHDGVVTRGELTVELAGRGVPFHVQAPKSF